MLAALAIGLPVSLWSAGATAADSFVRTATYSADERADDSLVRTVSYSTGSGGQKLKWLPYRPSKSTPKSGRTIMERVAQYTLEVPAQPVAVDPFDDPFEDGVGLSQLPRTIQPLEGDASERVAFQPLPQSAGPGLLTGEPPLEAESSEQSEEVGESRLDQELAAGPGVRIEPCPDPEDLKRIDRIKTDISAPGTKFPEECPLEDDPFQPRAWAPTTFTWKASALCHKPAYFEDVHLEQYGHSWGPYVQPVISGAHFFLTVPVLPYKMGLYPPGECIYSLGYYRPGSCAPYMLDPLPLSVRAGLAEAGAWTGLIFAIP